MEFFAKVLIHHGSHGLAEEDGIFGGGELASRLLTNRPRKTLGGDTPTERLRELLLAA